ncbi:transcriptional regulator with XRE-family HTH domain [Conyzicola lurida]|uniref:Transcriptional regulator with XRE-family HTH domain n=1 Tax=Conyzicola lurida TaxID=1172621 RepID=A0A841ARS2_9MICO|nr:helix-turn-helix transcriptional regulator [Conyzicola lurida]MBB5844642.1 transcriptional regulator with XRE-family HTH domain [Conyzicola lurida]
MENPELAAFVRTRREALQPEDVGLPRGQRRRTPGLRREEVAALAGMSSDYYARLERGNGPQPSEQMVAAIARALRLSLDERDHLFLLAGHGAPHRVQRTDHVSPGLMRVLDRLQDTPAQIMTALGETLVQTPLAVALLGEQTGYTGARRANVYRWFTEPESRSVYRASDQAAHGRTFVAQLRHALALQGPGSPAAALVRRLRGESDEFAEIWDAQEVGREFHEKHFAHAELGELVLHCQILLEADQQQSLLVFTATPGSESYEKLQLLGVIGSQRLSGARA